MSRHRGKLFELAIAVLEPAGEIRQLLFGLFPRRHIARDFQKTLKRSAFVAPGRDHDICPKLCSISAQTPIFVLETTLLRRYFQLVLRPASVCRFGRIERGNVLSDDL